MSIIIPAKMLAKTVLIFMHGYGSSAEDLARAGEYISQRCQSVEVHLLNAPYEMDHGRMWFNMDHTGNDHGKIMAVFAERIKVPAKMLAEYVEKVLIEHPKLSKKDVILAGFSQGGMMALHVGLQLGVGKIIAFSSLLVDESAINKSYHPKVLVVYGDADEIFSTEIFEKSRAQLKHNGVNFEVYLEHGLNHSISEKALNRGIDFIDED